MVLAPRCRPPGVEAVPLPARGIWRVQPTQFTDVWGREPTAVSPTRRWLREELVRFFGRGGGAGNRFADPFGQYRETYGATCLTGSLLELWANDVPDEATVIAAQRVRRVTWDAPYELGVLPADRVNDYDAVRLWLPNGEYADVGSIRTRTWLIRQTTLRDALVRARAIGPRLDSGLVEGSGPRSRLITQRIGRLLYEDPAAFTGIRFRTRLGGRHENWAVFYRRPIGILERGSLRFFGPAILEALEQLGLRR